MTNDSLVTEDGLVEVLRAVRDPALDRSLGELQMIGGAEIGSDGTVRLRVVLPTPAYPQRRELGELIRNTVREKFPQIENVQLEFASHVRGKESGGTLGLRIKNIIAVGAGKGGVGKSTVAAALAYGLKECGAAVGLLDADVYGPSIPHMVGVCEQPGMREIRTESGQTVQRILPLEAGGVRFISMGLIVPPEKAVVWRGPLLHRAIMQFLKDTDWGELDYLIVDLPPGTGDVVLTLAQSVGLAGGVIVCTPQQVALLDAVKAVHMFREVNIPVLGLVENMTGEVFGRGGARQKAEELGLPFLGEIPIDPDIRVKTDAGQIARLFEEGSPSREALLQVCQQTALEIARNALSTSALPTLEIL